MSKKLTLDISQAKTFFTSLAYEEVKKEVVAAHKLLRSKKGAGNDFLLPFSYFRCPRYRIF